MIYIQTKSFGQGRVTTTLTPLNNVRLKHMNISPDSNTFIEIVDEMEHNRKFTSGSFVVHVARLCVELDGELYAWKEWDLRT